MNELIKRIVTWAKSQPEIMAIYLYGSVANGHANALSDLDMGLLLRDDLTKQEIWRLEDRWSALWPKAVDLRVVNHAPITFQFTVTTQGQRLWAVDDNSVAEQESLIWRKYWDEALRLKAEMGTHLQKVMEARNGTEQQQYQLTLEKIGAVHRRVREAAASALR